ncbi:hypothetical protein BDN70DRAFT_895297 [Pholiota conissans]|uniref:Uncharacterized protein n=1 Tax=Pholiota conissans TaxID=109636 RepID=A0A9P6D054_9AGAR|nr:hypothetical protein BDN70DRAFT_895297 [Pholiota conissans]
MPESVDALEAQLALLNSLAPYYRSVYDATGGETTKDETAFLERLYDWWFIFWRLKIQDFGGTAKSLSNATKRKQQWIVEQLQLAASTAPEGPLERSWQMQLTVWEGRCGVSAKRKYTERDNSESVETPTRPCPRPKKAKLMLQSSGEMSLE